MAKRKKGRPGRPGLVPVMVVRQFVDTEMSLKEHMAVRAIGLGCATPAHYHILLDMHGILLIATKLKPLGSDEVRKYARTIIGPILHNIKLHYDQTEIIHCSDYELSKLKRLPTIYRDFWAGQHINLYKHAFDRLQAYYNNLISSEEAGLTEPNETEEAIWSMDNNPTTTN